MINETNQLSEREREVLRLVAAGQSNQQIANTLGISVNTVKVHLRNVFGKIGVASRTEATMYAVRSGIVTLEKTELQAAAVLDEPVSQAQPNQEPPLDDANVAVASEAQIFDPTPPLNGTDAAQTSVPPAPTAPHKDSIVVTGSDVVRSSGSSRAIGIAAAVALLVVVGIVVGALVRARPASGVNPEGLTQTEQARWSIVTSMPQPRAGFAIENVAEQIYIIGGENQTGVLGLVERFDVRNMAWSELSAKPTPVTDVQAVALGGKIYVPGGRLSSDPADLTDVFERYDPRAEQWETLPKLPAPRSGYALAAVEGKLYLFGGWDGKSYRSDVFESDPDLNQWIEGTAMPTSRAFADAVVVEGNVYVLGGENGPNRYLNTNEVYTPAQEEGQPWARKTPMPQPRSRFGTAAALRTVHVFGGDAEATPLKYNVGIDNWEPFPSGPDAIGSQPGVIQQEERILIFGGKLADQFSDVVQSYQALYNNILTIPQ